MSDSCILPAKDEISEFIQKMYDDLRSFEKRFNALENRYDDDMWSVENRLDRIEYTLRNPISN